ncbi:long-chain-fatty-acid--CoA ligase [Halobacillus litoralis]|uniref:Long-chain-fatty-acid--CoA ligase n=1 Tax=Halobacillus litoralis TaxID=45668 RepID=A0A845DQV4_9BACI|nr:MULTISPECIES: long-chain-fatty-acid--CoA ligase [Halobacillus]MCA1021843.1 long-chain-fatty-acid--CoA ligase [Halobacillus litoralis]MYL19981.1 long-chain-fatty-acid--CoA ligase [Halobacillus litoralis]MYL29118.1 long-chain-fatty-acid--CoA ligase [Halobacillus halophilus]
MTDFQRPWHKYYPPEVPVEMEYDQRPLQDYLRDTAQAYGEKKALYFMGKELSYKEVYDQSLAVASYLQQLGVEKGDRVSIMLPNCPQSVVAYYGVLLAGGIVVQTNPLYMERELEYQMKDSGAKVIICLDILYPKAANVKPETDLEHIIVTGIKDYLPFPKNKIYPFIQKRQYQVLVKPEQSTDTHLWTHLLKESTREVKPVEVDPLEDLALLQYTGGTTGFPKGVMLTHYNLIVNTQMAKKWLYKCRDGEERVLAILPFFHVYGMTSVMNLSVMMGNKMILMPKFDAEAVLKVIEKQRPTLFPGAPTIYIALLNHPNLKKYDLSSIEACISGSAPLPVEVQEQFEKITGGRLVEGYGLTETSPTTHSNLIWGHRISGSIGIPWPDTDSKIFKMDADEEADYGEIGEIVVKGPQVMKGYWNRPEETAQVLSEDGWFRTGDMGYMNEDGYFYIVDRKKDMIIAGGYNIYPREVEEVLYEHSEVQEAVVVGVPDPYRGETVKAFIVRKQGSDITEDELNEFCRKHMASFKAPRLYEFREELPKTAVGKILRRQLVEEEKAKYEESESIQ